MKNSAFEGKKRLFLYILTASAAFALFVGTLFIKAFREMPGLLLIGYGILFGAGIYFASKLSLYDKSQLDAMVKRDISYLVDNVPSPFFIISNHEIVYMNQAMKTLTNYETSGISIPFDFYKYVPKETHKDVDAWVSGLRHMESGTELKLKLNMQSKAALWLSLHASILRSSDGSYILVSAFDITKIKKDELMQKRLGDLKDQIILLADTIQNHDSIVPLLEKILDIALSKISKSLFGSFLVLENNEYFRIAAYRGFPPEEIAGAHIPLVKSFAYLASGGNIKKTQIIDDISTLPHDSAENLLSFTGTLSWELRSTLTTPIFLNGKLYGSINIDSKEVNAFTEEDALLMEFFRENVEKAIETTEKMIQLKTMSYFDGLTGLYNRAYFDEAITEAIYQADQERLPFSVAVADLDCLKNINDEFGHTGGDMLLKHFSEALTKFLPQSSVICRYGGDEFTVLFPAMEEAAGLNAMECFVKNLKNYPLRFGDHHITVCLSYGVSEYDLGAHSPISVLEKADGKMYEMKWLHKKEILEATEANKK